MALCRKTPAGAMFVDRNHDRESDRLRVGKSGGKSAVGDKGKFM